MKKKTKVLLAVALCLCLVSMVFASIFQSSFGAVKVKDLNVVLANGKSVNAQIFIPKGASEENKVPLIVISHGSYTAPCPVLSCPASDLPTWAPWESP